MTVLPIIVADPRLIIIIIWKDQDRAEKLEEHRRNWIQVVFARVGSGPAPSRHTRACTHAEILIALSTMCKI